MSNQQIPQQPQFQPYQNGPGYVPQMPVTPVKPSKLKRFGLPVGLLLLGLVIGGASGASAVPEPVVQVQERRVEVPVEKIVKETPASCLSALEHSEEIIQSSARTVGVFVEILDAVQVLDAAKITSLNPKIEAETDVLDTLRPKYQSARDSCRASR
jgi:hypothetical protein